MEIPRLDGMPQQVTVPPLRIRLDQVDFTWVMRADEAVFMILWKHPVFPLAIEIPFEGLFYLRSFAENAQKVVEAFEQKEAST